MASSSYAAAKAAFRCFHCRVERNALIAIGLETLGIHDRRYRGRAALTHLRQSEDENSDVAVEAGPLRRMLSIG